MFAFSHTYMSLFYVKSELLIINLVLINQLTKFLIDSVCD